MFDFINAEVIAVTKPVVDYIPDSEGIIAYAARVSSPDNQSNFDTAAKLLKYCVNHKHFSVFETTNLVMQVEAPRDIARQLLRHRSFTFQEFSQRYAQAQNFCYREARMQDTKNRQNSIETDDSDLKYDWQRKQEEVLRLVKDNYKWALDNGIAKEVARVILPEGNTMSRLYVNGTVRSWLHYCDLRDGNGTQLEHVDLAQKCKIGILKYFPFLDEVCSSV